MSIPVEVFFQIITETIRDGQSCLLRNTILRIIFLMFIIKF